MTMTDNKNRMVVVGNIGLDTHVYLQGQAFDLVHEANFTSNLDTVGQAVGYASRAYQRLGAHFQHPQLGAPPPARRA